MVFDIKKEERDLFNLIAETAQTMHIDAYIVGGYVRDRLLGRATNDLDIVCIGSGPDLAHNLAEQLKPKPRVTIFKRFGTAMLRHGDIELEFVGARKESYRHDSRKPAIESGTLEDDQNRRDFTINALAVSLNERNFGQIIDPFNGLADLEHKILRTPLEAGKTFSDDPLRMMRAIRFANQLNFQIEPETFEAIRVYKNRIQIVSKERITTELEKIMYTPKPSTGFKLLFDSGLLEIIFPELTALHGVEFRDGKGHKDNFYHTLQVLDNICEKTKNIWLRWAALLHDIAKPPTKRFDPDQGWTFHGHEALGAAMIPRIFRRMRLPMDHKMKYVQKLVRLHLRPINLAENEVTDSAVRRLLFEAGDDIDDLLTLCEADITSKNNKKVSRYLQNYAEVRKMLLEVEEKDKLRNWQPPISGELIMETFNIKPSREVGILKTAIREAILEGEIPNDFEVAFHFLLKKGSELGLTPIQGSN